MQKVFDTISFMKRTFALWLLPVFLLQGCLYFNNEAVGTRKYHDCEEYYDAEGIYHKECDKNLAEYDDVIEVEGHKLLF
jgi:hypothetical protein